MFKVFVTPTFEKSFKKLKNNFTDTDLLKVIKILESDPFNQSKKFNIRKLKNIEPGSWRIRIGEYRIRYDIIEDKVILHLVMHRKDIYS